MSKTNSVTVQGEWVKKQGRFQSGAYLKFNGVTVGSYAWVGGELPYKVFTTLPGFKIPVEYCESEEYAKKVLLKFVATWFEHFLKGSNEESKTRSPAG